MNKTTSWPYAKLVYGLVGLLWVGYVALLFFTKGNDHYHLSFTATNIIRISFATPILLVWLSAAAAAVRFKTYATLVKGSREATGFHRLASGLFFLLGYLIALLLLGQIATQFAGTSMVNVAVFTKNHLPAYLFAISLVQLYRGSAYLADSATAKPTRPQLMTLYLGYLTFTILFVALFFGASTPNQSLVSGLPAFAVPHSVLLFTLVLPSLLSWFFGLMAGLMLRAYLRRVKGVIYKASLRSLVIGISATTTFAMLVEFLVLNSTRLQHLGLNAVLLIVYAFLVAYAVGAWFISRAAAKLTLIEVAE